MVRQEFSVDGYWQVIVYYSLDYDLFFPIVRELEEIGFSDKDIMKLYSELKYGRAKAVTCSSLEHKVSIVLFGEHQTKKDFINSIVHEAEHIKQAMLDAYGIEDKGEPPAYTIGYLVGRMYSVFRYFLAL
jgi:hypothetical protein